MTQSEPTVPLVFADPTSLTDRLEEADGILVGFDFDGTLAPIADDPDAPTLSAPLQRSLDELAARDDVSVAVVSGRALEDLRSRVPLENVILAGNHGLERYHDGERRTLPGSVSQRESLRSVCTTLRSTLADVPGCFIEDKGLTITVHVRQTPDEYADQVRKEIHERAATNPDLTVTRGKQVFEIRPNTPHDKGTTMQLLQDEVPDEWLTLYIGDDTTDEDAFEALQPDGVGIHVGSRSDTAADFRLPSQAAVPSFVTWVLTRRHEHDSSATTG